MTITAYTSIAANYLPKARVLAHTLKAHNPGMRFALVMTDTVPEDFALESEPFDLLLTIDQLDIPDWKPWLFGHTIVEACTAVKPFALNRLLGEYKSEIVYYFDPDIAVFDRLTSLHEALEDASVLLTPHLYEQEATLEAIADNELSVLKHGLYNLGFVGVKNDEQGKAFADWWQHRCFHYCYDDIPNGVFTDQKWVDLAPLFFDRARILKEPQYNVCTWNYSTRRIEGDADAGFTVNGKPLSFHHFSGYDSGAHEAMLAKYGEDMPATKRLSQWYLQQCAEYGQDDGNMQPWAYGCYDNGEAILPLHRKTYRMRDDLRKAFPNPYEVDGNSYARWLKEQGPREGIGATPGAMELSFGQFLEQTEAQLIAFLQRSPRLNDWQRKTLKVGVQGAFGSLRSLWRMAGRGSAQADRHSASA